MFLLVLILSGCEMKKNVLIKHNSNYSFLKEKKKTEALYQEFEQLLTIKDIHGLVRSELSKVSYEPK